MRFEYLYPLYVSTSQMICFHVCTYILYILTILICFDSGLVTINQTSTRSHRQYKLFLFILSSSFDFAKKVSIAMQKQSLFSLHQLDTAPRLAISSLQRGTTTHICPELLQKTVFIIQASYGFQSIVLSKGTESLFLPRR